MPKEALTTSNKHQTPLAQDAWRLYHSYSIIREGQAPFQFMLGISLYKSQAQSTALRGSQQTQQLLQKGAKKE